MKDKIRTKILAPLNGHRVMTLATLRPDGWPQAATVSYVNEDVTLYSFAVWKVRRQPISDMTTAYR